MQNIKATRKSSISSRNLYGTSGRGSWVLTSDYNAKFDSHPHTQVALRQVHFQTFKLYWLLIQKEKADRNGPLHLLFAEFTQQHRKIAPPEPR